MAPTAATRRSDNGIEQVRARLLTALHVGRLHPGDRVLSVRRLADLTGLNRKTIHRAYTFLAREGLLEVRPGSGTFITDRHSTSEDAPTTGRLLSSINRCRAEANRIGLSPDRFSAFLGACFGDELKGLPVTVAECNREQLGVIAFDLERTIGLSTRQILLADLESTAVKSVRGTRAVVTTDCHLSQVAGLVNPLGLPVYSVSLDPGLPRRLARLATTAPVVMIVRDRAFAPVFLRLLKQMHVESEIRERFVIVEPAYAEEAMRDLDDPAHVYVSPLVSERTRLAIPVRMREIRDYWRVPIAAIDRLRAGLAFDLASRPR